VDSSQANLPATLPGLSFLAGTDRSWLVALSESGPLGLSTHRIYQASGKITREFQPIRLNAGVAVVAVPAGADRHALVVAAMPVTRFQDNVQINNPPPYQGPREIPPSGAHQLLWSDPASLWDSALWVLPDDRSAAAAWGVSVSTLRASGNGWASPPGRVGDAWEKATMDATSGIPTGEGTDEPAWYAYGALPDGRGFVVADAQIGNDPSYLYGAIWDHGKRTDLYGGKVDPTAVLPVKLRFPDGQGWLVAAKGATFQYLTDTWHDAGSNAALVPAGATQVRVTPAGKQPTVVSLG
jgi:hypothetical protein